MKLRPNFESDTRDRPVVARLNDCCVQICKHVIPADGADGLHVAALQESHRIQDRVEQAIRQCDARLKLDKIQARTIATEHDRVAAVNRREVAEGKLQSALSSDDNEQVSLAREELSIAIANASALVRESEIVRSLGAEATRQFEAAKQSLESRITTEALEDISKRIASARTTIIGALQTDPIADALAEFAICTHILGRASLRFQDKTIAEAVGFAPMPDSHQSGHAGEADRVSDAVPTFGTRRAAAGMPST